MAIDQTEKKRTLAKNTVTQVTALLNAHRALVDILEEATMSGMMFVDTDFEVDGLRHLDAVTFNALGTPNGGAIGAIDTVLRANNAAHFKTFAKVIK
jgi:hypothetical protein